MIRGSLRNTFLLRRLADVAQEVDDEGAYNKNNVAGNQYDDATTNGNGTQEEQVVAVDSNNNTIGLTLLLSLILVLTMLMLIFVMRQYYLQRTSQLMNEHAKAVMAELIDEEDDDDKFVNEGSPPRSPKQQKTAWIKTQMELVKPRPHKNHNEYVNISDKV